LVREESVSTPASRAREPRLALTWLDRLAATALVEGSPSELVDFLELVRGCAESLAGEDAVGARQRLLSREIAIAKATLDATTAAIGQRARANDASGALLADKLATSAAKRLAMLLDAHRAETTAKRRGAVVAIGHAEHVTVEAE
jgi:hypothetical protein